MWTVRKKGAQLVCMCVNRKKTWCSLFWGCVPYTSDGLMDQLQPYYTIKYRCTRGHLYIHNNYSYEWTAIMVAATLVSHTVVTFWNKFRRRPLNITQTWLKQASKWRTQNFPVAHTKFHSIAYKQQIAYSLLPFTFLHDVLETD